MGRVIRRVALDWVHPRNAQGQYIPLLDADYEADAQDWLRNLMAWEHGDNPARSPLEAARGRHCYFWEYAGNPPQPQDYMPPVPEETIRGYQVYETETNGTPLSPVLTSPEAIFHWLIETGWTEADARLLVSRGWSFAAASPATEEVAEDDFSDYDAQ